MNCCINCFNDKEIIRQIKKTGIRGTCSFCKSNSLCVDTNDLKEKFSYLFEIYTPDIDFKFYEDMDDNPGTPLWERVQEDWNIFKDNTYEILSDMFEPHSKHDLTDQIDIEANVEIEEEYIGSDETESILKSKIWTKFKHEIKHKNRFFHKNDMNFLTEIILPYETKKTLRRYYRARIYQNSGKFVLKDLKKPASKKCLSGGRGNPPGISYLYLASSVSTAICEVRPTVGDKVAVGEFNISNVSLIDLRKPFLSSPFKYGSKLKKAYDYRRILSIFSHELSRPILPYISSIEYVPTQYLCEFIKSLKFDGIIYNSSVTSGFNLLLFRDFGCKKFEDYIIKKINLRYDLKKPI